jgi:hypothetical protein
MIALKLTHVLESKGYTGKVILVDGSPKFISNIVNQLLPTDYNDEHIQGFILSSCIKILFPESIQEVTKKIFSNSELDKRFETFLETAATRSEYSIDYGRQMIEGLMKRLKIILKANDINFVTLKCSVTLVKASESSLSGIDEDYGIKNFVENDVKIHTVNGNHVSVLTSAELIDIINS